ncbi:BON domain-containing protein [Argonema antarcticum]|uniref:BON domain-containing protein n=1 Tax=Argonema antarcticum TaxID=2942763 RepID=UPI002010E32D|nr:BON domain-containing protein [Argonema antarcticum]MCL1469361.1 BON domain-containing protein [Argonema antarcticum A004/B2]
MGFLQRLFGMEKPADAQTNPAPVESAPDGGEIAPERVGLNGEYDQSGLAKRVALAFDQDSELADIDRLWVAQTGGTVVLKGEVPNQDILNKIVSVASNVNGATNVDTDQVQIG